MFRSIVRHRALIRRVSAGRSSSVLVIAEHDGKTLNPCTLSAATAARQICNDVTLLLIGHQTAPLLPACTSISGVKNVLVVDSESLANFIAEDVTKVLVDVIKSKGFSHIIASATNKGKSVIPRAAAILNTSPISDVISIKSENTFLRPTYAGNALSTVTSSDSIKLMTIRATAFDKSTLETPHAKVESLSVTFTSSHSKFISSSSSSSSSTADLTTARVVVSGGRALKDAANFHILTELAAALDPKSNAVGASRAAVDAGYAPNEMQVGQTGKVVNPDLYVAVGISGAIQHVSGMKDSKIIVAINKDKEAPIFQIADYGIVDDLFKVVPELTKAAKMK